MVFALAASLITTVFAQSPGSLDVSYHSGAGPDDDAAAWNYPFAATVVVQPDGKTVVRGGFFTSFDGVRRNRIVRLASSGTVDPSFDPGTGVSGGPLQVFNAPPALVDLTRISATALQGDGRILIGGAFTNVSGIPRNGIARLETNGNVEVSFDPGMSVGAEVRAISVLGGGEVLISGSFERVADMPRHNLARLNTDGSLDYAFVPPTDRPNDLRAAQPDGKLIVVGYDETRNLSNIVRLVRLNVDGILDPSFGNLDITFDPASGFASAGNDIGGIYCVLPLNDGSILVGGHFRYVNGRERHAIARLNVDGSVDENFDLALAPQDTIGSLTTDPSGKIIVAGHFSSIKGSVRNHIARLNPDWTIDPSFVSGSIVGDPPGDFAYPLISSVGLQPDGNLVIAGLISAISGTPRHRVARLHGNETGTLLFNASRGPSSFQCSVLTIVGRSYTLQYVDGITKTNWTSTTTVTGDATVKNLSDTNAIGEHRFYRGLVGQP